MRLLLWYMLLLLLVQAPLAHKHYRAEHFKKLVNNNDVRWVWVDDPGIASISNKLDTITMHDHHRQHNPYHNGLPPYSHSYAPPIATSKLPDVEEVSGKYIVGSWDSTLSIAKQHTSTMIEIVYKNYVVLYANIVWTPLIHLYLDGYSFWDGRVGFWDGLPEAQICGELKKHNESGFWERNKLSCRQIIFERLNSFLESIHFTIFIFILWSCYRSIHDAAMMKIMMSGVTQEVKTLVVQEMKMALSTQQTQR